MTFVGSATASSSRSDDDAMSVCIVEEERQRNRRRPAATLRADGGCGRSPCPSSSPMYLTWPPPRSLTSPRKTHQQTLSYLWSETLSVEDRKARRTKRLALLNTRLELLMGDHVLVLFTLRGLRPFPESKHNPQSSKCQHNSGQ